MASGAKNQNCRLQTISVWKSLKFVVWEGVNRLYYPIPPGGNLSKLMVILQNLLNRHENAILDRILDLKFHKVRYKYALMKILLRLSQS